MRKILIAAAAGLMTLSAIPFAASAASVEPQMRPYNQQGPMNGPMNHNGPGVRPGPDGQYGTWDDRWGARPGAPPRGYARHNDWYRHVRACSQRYRSYNPRTDTFVVRHGRTAVCRL
ncbi:hypothetical protein BH10PSE1_BH10PSE1_26220 [soil metagenome]